MITIDIYRDDKGLINEYKVVGHADSVKDGFDPVCALISLTTQAPIIGLEEHLKRKLSLVIKQEEGILEVKLQNAADDLTEAILATMVLTLADLEKKYPEILHTKEHRR